MKPEKRILIFKKKFGFEPQAFELCPRFEICSCNSCPLDLNYPQIKSLPEDPEIKCKISKPIRKEIGEFFKLKLAGLTEREFSFKIREQKLTPEQKQARKERFMQNVLLSPINSKTGAKIRELKEDILKPKDKSQTFENSAIVEADGVEK